MFPRRQRFSCLGLTPIEVIVVFGGVSLLAGALAAGASRDSASDRRTRCLGNLRGIMQTALTYAENDPNHILGPVTAEAPYFMFEGYMEYGGGPGTMSFTGWGEEFDPRFRPFNQMLYGLESPEPSVGNTAPGDPSVFKEFQCPGLDQGWQEWPGWGSDPRETETAYFQANGTAFRMNNLTYDDGLIFGIYGRSAQRVPAPASTVAFMEARVFQTIFTNEVWGLLEAGELTSYHERLGFFNGSYADGHAAFADFGTGTFYQHLPEYDDYDIRGTWGRMDCLPGPPSGDGFPLVRSAGCLPVENTAMRRVGS